MSIVVSLFRRCFSRITSTSRSFGFSCIHVVRFSRNSSPVILCCFCSSQRSFTKPCMSSCSSVTCVVSFFSSVSSFVVSVWGRSLSGGG